MAIWLLITKSLILTSPGSVSCKTELASHSEYMPRSQLCHAALEDTAGRKLALRRLLQSTPSWIVDCKINSCCPSGVGSGSGEPSEEDVAVGRRSTRARRPTQRLDARDWSASEPGPNAFQSRFPSRLRATVHRYFFPLIMRATHLCCYILLCSLTSLHMR